SLYADVGSVSFTGGGICSGNRRHGWRSGRNGDRANRGTRAAVDEQLRDSIFYRGVGLPCWIVVGSHPESEIGAGGSWVRLKRTGREYSKFETLKWKMENRKSELGQLGRRKLRECKYS